MATKLFDRDYNLTIGTRDVTGLDIAFNVKKSLKPEPNTCEIQVFNLSNETREELSKPKALDVRLEAGYKEGISQIYFGQVRYAFSEVKGPDIVTTLNTGDGDKKHARSRISVPMGPRTNPSVALDQIAGQLGVKSGNFAKAKAQLALKGEALFPVPFIIYGGAAQVMTDFCRSAGLEWSIQDGQLQILDIGKALEPFPLILSSDSGLLDSPSIDSEGVVTAKILMIPDIRPGVRVEMDSRFVKGPYRIEQAHYRGDTNGNEWHVDIKCKKIKT